MKKQLHLRKHHLGRRFFSQNFITLAVVLVGVCTLGVFLITSSHATTPYVSSEAENGALTGAATVNTNIAASGGKYISFGSTSLTPLPTAANPQWGVLLADTKYITTDYAAGVRSALIDLSWSSWEPNEGTMSSSEMSSRLAAIKSYVAAGYTVGIELGLNHVPSWVLSQPNGQQVDQFGNSSGMPDYQYNASVRKLADAYMSSVQQTLGQYVSYYRIGLSNTGEALYPQQLAGQSNEWWAFDANAQGTIADNRPIGVPVTPMAGWIPGTTSWNGQTVTTAMAQNWYNWYMGAEINALTWEATTLKNDGYTDRFMLPIPGTGSNEYVYTHRMASLLAPESYDSFATLNEGAVYQTLIPAIAQTGLPFVINTTSVGDESGTPADNMCTASDDSLDYTTTDVTSWSSTRWQAYLAAKSHLIQIGESTGQNDAANMTHTFQMVKACGLVSLLWAFDNQLYGGTYATINDYQSNIQSWPNN